jgi:hypothetical protein
LESIKREKGLLGWFLLAGLLFAIGCVAYLPTLTSHVTPDSVYINMTSSERMMTIAENGYSFAHFGGIAFIIGGFVVIGLALFIKFKG